MKHIGWCLERIQIAMRELPEAVESEEDKQKALGVIDEVQEYAKTLAEIIRNPKFKKILSKLESSSDERIKLQGHEIEKLLSDLNLFGTHLQTYDQRLRYIVNHDPSGWKKTHNEIVRIIYEFFCEEMGELRREFKVALHKEEELRELISSEKHLEEMLS